MRIADLRVFPFALTYRKPWRISSGTIRVAEHVLVEVVGTDGTRGYGDACPFPVGYASETQETMLAVISRYLRPAVTGMDPLDIEAVQSAMDVALPGHVLAKAGVEMALYDLAGRALRLPVHKLIGGKYRDQLSLGWSIGIRETVEETVREALHYAQSGFAAIKLKIGVQPKKDLEKLAEVREALGPNIKLRVDANEGLRSADALPILRKMEKFDLEYIEQPVPRWDLAGMARLAKALDTPILADEAVFTPGDAVNVVRAGAAGILNVYPAKMGIANSRKIAAIAEGAGLTCVLGSMLESGLGNSANLQFACSTRNVREGCELIGPLFFTSDILATPIFSAEPPNGVWNVLDGDGLGVEIDTNWLESVARTTQSGNATAGSQVSAAAAWRSDE